MKIKILASLLFLLFVSPNIFSQSDFRKGYIITLDNNFVQGDIDYRNNSKKYKSCLFRGPNGQHEYSPDEIKGYAYDKSKFFSSQIVEGTFVEVLVDGILSLYKAQDRYYVKKDTTLVDLQSEIITYEEDGKQGKRDKYNWKGKLSYIISDCIPNSQKAVEKVTFGEQPLTKLVIRYNKCVGTNFVEYKQDRPWTAFEYGVVLGYKQSSFDTEVQTRDFIHLSESYESGAPSFGAMISLYSPRIMETLAFQTEFLVYQTKYNSEVIKEDIYTRYHDVHITMTTLSIPLSMKYGVPFGGNRYEVYFQGGVNLDIHFNKESTWYEERVFKGTVNTEPVKDAFPLAYDQFGLWGGIGFLKNFDSFKASLALRYSKLNEIDNSDTLDTTNNQVSINLTFSK